MSTSFPKTYKAAVLEKANSPFVLKSLELKQPGPGQVLVKVLACGVCGTDVFEQLGHLWNSWPIVPGHELVGDVAAVGEGVSKFKAGDRVGGPWHGGHDRTCRSCQRSQFQMCDDAKVNGVHFDGGYAEYTLLRAEAVVRVPPSADPVEVAPLLCAGVTVFNGLRKLHVEQGATVAVQGLGGLGHMAVQYASRMGYKVIVLSGGGDGKKEFARQLGASDFIDTKTEDAVEALKQRGLADVIICTAPSPDAISPMVGGLAKGGKLLVLAPVGPVPFDTAVLVNKGASVIGWPSGHALDSEEAIDFALTHGVKCLTEAFPLSDVQKAFDAARDGKVRFRAVLTM